MNILITYDVSAKNIEMKAALERIGYSDCWVVNGKTYYLPNTTLWKENSTVQQGKLDMISAARSLNVRLERAIAVPSAPWDGIEGEPHR